MKKNVFVLVLILSLLGAIAFAAETPVSEQAQQEQGKVKTNPVVATIYLNNSKSTFDAEIMKALTDRFNAKLAKYTIVPGDKYVAKLNKMGITDITTAERTDIVEVFAGEGVDYLVYAEVQPPILERFVSFWATNMKATVSMPVKIVDIKNNKYLYNGKITEIGDDSNPIGDVAPKASVMKALGKIFDKADEVLSTRLPN